MTELKSRILITGGRDCDYDLVQITLSKLCKFFDMDYVLIHGGARGADMSAHMWAFYNGCAVIRMDANWEYYRSRAGSLRNGWMLKFAMPDLVIAFPGGNGTKDMVLKAKKAGITVHEVKNEG